VTASQGLEQSATTPQLPPGIQLWLAAAGFAFSQRLAFDAGCRLIRLQQLRVNARLGRA